MLVVKYRKVFFVISAVIVALSLGAVVVFGLNFGIDFTGGAFTEVLYPFVLPDGVSVEERLRNLSIGGFSLRPIGDDRFILRTRDLEDEERQSVLSALSLNGRRQLV